VTFKVPSRDPSAALGMTERSSQLRKQGGLSFFFGQRARTLLAFFHDELIQRRINRQGIVPVKTSETKRIGGSTGRLNHSFDAQIAEAIDVEILANLLHRHLVSDQLFRIGEIDAVMTGEAMGRAAYPQMHFSCAGLTQIHD